MELAIRDEKRRLDDLKPHGRNFNRHNRRQIERLAAAMSETAFTAPIICRDDGTILGGHARREALLHLREMGTRPPGVGADWKIPCRIVTGATAAQEKRILVNDNPAADTLDYDNSILTELLAEIGAGEALTGTWYDDADMARMVAETARVTQELVEDGGELSNETRALSERTGAVVKPVIAIPDVSVFERALALTGCRARGEALRIICQAYVDSKRGEG